MVVRLKRDLLQFCLGCKQIPFSRSNPAVYSSPWKGNTDGARRIAKYIHQMVGNGERGNKGMEAFYDADRLSSFRIGRCVLFQSQSTMEHVRPSVCLSVCPASESNRDMT